MAKWAHIVGKKGHVKWDHETPKFLICINCFALKLLVVATQQRQGRAPH